MPLSWAKTELEESNIEFDANKKIYIISDLHLGDGTRSDSFRDKRIPLRELFSEIKSEEAHLIIAGDLIDFHQGWSIDRIITAHAILFRELSDLAQETGVTYLWGNHDFELSYFKELLNFQVHSSATIGDIALIEHGHQYDSAIGRELQTSPRFNKLHHVTERLLDTWLRFPLENFPNIENRILFWVFHKLFWLQSKMGEKFPNALSKKLKGIEENQLGNPSGLFEAVQKRVEEIPQRYLITGHSHLPGIVEFGEKGYINTGSWCFDASQYLVWDGEKFELNDWQTKMKITDQAYRPLLDGEWKDLDFLGWWKENYRGWLRFHQNPPQETNTEIGA